MTTTNNEKKIWTYCRGAAREMLRLRRSGQLTAAYKVEQDALRTVELMRGAR